MNFLIRLVINAVAIWVAKEFVDGIIVTSSGRGDGWDIVVLLGIAAVLTVVNAFIRPLVRLLSLPLLILTLGLFTLVINALMLLLTAWLSSQTGYGLEIIGFAAAFWGAIIISIVNFLLGAFVPEKR
ncbi:phage holin family protein [Rhodococcus sp. AW25M09]|uniref:phage holin family protein n=1 Tax=Rhodococcus sp. AW25M09 TaxID=1268303 RepID=UPI000345F6B1|nr:phage holin family protein [Rhodococcus sp. AW25M09]